MSRAALATGSQTMLCKKYRAKIPCSSCAARQLERTRVGPQRRSKSPEYLTYCGSGQCAQGSAVLERLGAIQTEEDRYQARKARLLVRGLAIVAKVEAKQAGQAARATLTKRRKKCRTPSPSSPGNTARPSGPSKPRSRKASST